MLTLKVEKRDKKENLNLIRENKEIPAVFYGPKEKSTPIKLSEINFMKAWKEAGESTIISLKEGSEDHDVLIHDVDVDPVKGNVRHVDFYVIEKGKKVTVDVTLEFEGEAPAEKNLGGTLVKVMHQVEIEAMPKDLPHELKVSIDGLADFDSQLHAKDIKMPEGVTLLTDPEEVVALVQEPKEEVEEESEAPDLDSIEVEGEKKKEEDDGSESSDNKEEKEN